MENNTMMQAIFAKKKTTKEGKIFHTYLTTLKKKTGEEIIAQVKFRDICGSPEPEKCPMNIVFPRSKANMTVREYTREDTREICEQYVMWVSEWAEGKPYRDTSMDEFI